jgi:thiamine biosynthesis lipoprotein ApbE
MKKSYIKVVYLLLVILLLTISCSNGTGESEIEAQENDDLEVVENFENTDENLSKESPESEAVDAEVTEVTAEIEVIEPTESEIELFNQLAGGFFYTKDSGDDYSEMRKESINIFIDQMITVLEDGYDNIS